MARKLPWKFLGLCSIAAVAALAVAVINPPQPAIKAAAGNNSARVLADFGKLPLYFIENQGQVDRRASYYLQGKDKSVFFTSGGVVFALTEEREPGSPFQPASYQPTGSRDRWAVKLEFVGANPDVRPVGIERTEAVVNFFKGRKENWKTGVATYAGVAYKDLWPGIDLVYAGTDGRLKYTFTVAPDSNPAEVKLAYRGASAVKLDEHGRLAIETPLGGFQEDRPYVYQEIDGQRVEVESAYELTDGGYNFHVGEYDHTRPLVLDPVLLVYAGYIGGAVSDHAAAVAVDDFGNAYIAGHTASDETSFPVAVGPDISFNGSGQSDVFVAKVNAAGTALVYAGYIGGSFSEVAFGIALDTASNAYVTGWTDSSDGTFPVTAGQNPTQNGGMDVFVTKVSAGGTNLIYSRFIGGSSDDCGNGIAVDLAGNAYVTGWTHSVNALDNTFPTTVGPNLVYNGDFDAFVTKLSATGTTLIYSGYIGGSSYDVAFGIDVDLAGNAYVTGYTESAAPNFPVTVGPGLTYNGTGEAFVAKVNAAGTALDYAGYIGGSGQEAGKAIAVDNAGNAYVTGFTSSRADTFPVKVGPDLTLGGKCDAFVAKVNATGTALIYAGYIGGVSDENGYGIAVDGAGAAYVTGSTWSDQYTFPVTLGPGTIYSGRGDAFVAAVKPQGTGLLYAGYIGGSNDDATVKGVELGTAIAVGRTGDAYVVGDTTSTQRSFPVTVGPALSYSGTTDAFVAKIRFAVSDVDADGLPDLSDPCPADPANLCNPAGSAAELVNPATGGVLETPNGALTLNLQPDAVQEPTTISVTQTVRTDPNVDLTLGASAGLGKALAVYDLKPDGLQFNSPVTLTIRADLSAVSPPLNSELIGKLRIYLRNPVTGVFEPVSTAPTDCTVAGSIATCVVSLSHFSVYALVAPRDSDNDGVADLFDGIRDVCPADPNVVAGLLSPLGALVPAGDSNVPLPEKAFRLGQTLPLKLRFLCGLRALTDRDSVPRPEIVGLMRTGDTAPLDLTNLDAGTANDVGPYFRYADSEWIYNLKTQSLTTGTYVITIKMPDGRQFRAGFVLR